jgi:hypothetical protein
MSHETRSIKEEVIAKIKKGEMVMRPRWHFVLRAVLYALGALIAALALIYLASFIIFILRETGLLFVPSFGFRGVGVFLFSLPWFLILLCLSFLFVLEVLVRRYAFAYRKPLLYSVFGIILFVALCTTVVASLGFHQGFSRYAKEGRFPVAGALYRSFEHPMNDHVFPGSIMAMTDDGFLMKDIRGKEFTVIITSDTRFPFGVDLTIGDRVVVFGTKTSTTTIDAQGVRRMDDTMRPPTHHRGWRPLSSPSMFLSTTTPETSEAE